MPEPVAGPGGARGPTRVVLVGDAGSGKTRLASAMARIGKHASGEEAGGGGGGAPAGDGKAGWLPPVLEVQTIAGASMADGVAMEIVDTSSDAKGEGAAARAKELASADAVVVAYRTGSEDALKRVTDVWLPLIRNECKSKDGAARAVPVVLAGCQVDRRQTPPGQAPEADAAALEATARPIMSAFREVETCLECSAATLAQVAEVFYFAQKAVLHPMAPLIDADTSSLTPKCVRALHRVFFASDTDGDGYLSDAELNAFQVRCFSAPLTPEEVTGVKEVVSTRCPGGGGVAPQGLTAKGFLFLHALFVERGRSETTWAVLRNHGYNDALEIREALTVPPPAVAGPSGWTHVPDDQRFQVTPEAMRYVLALVDRVAETRPGAPFREVLERVFSTCPSDPLGSGRPRLPAGVAGTPGLNDALVEHGLFSLRGCANLDAEPGAGFAASLEVAAACCPADLCAHLRCLGAPGATAEAHGGGVALGPRKRVDGEAGSGALRRVFEVHVFGAQGSGKSALVRGLATPRGKPSHDAPPRNLKGDDVNMRDGRVAIGYVTPAGWDEPGDAAPATADGKHPACVAGWDATWRHQRALMLREVRDLDGYLSVPASSRGGSEPRVAPLVRCDAAAFAVDGGDVASVAAAESAILRLCAAHAADNLPGLPPPCVLVVTKDDTGVDSAVLEAVKALTNRLNLPPPCMTSAKRGDYGGLYARLAALCCERSASAPVTPELRAAAATQLCRERALALATVGTGVIAGAMAWYAWFSGGPSAKAAR